MTNSALRFSKYLMLLMTALSLMLFSAQAEKGTLVRSMNLTEIQAEAFMNDVAIKKVIMPEGVVTIRANAFKDSGLTEINLPASLSGIDDTAFSGLKI